ncbi:N-acetylmuramoyl-L-alanine amidase [Sinosporangium siamense]|uniref:MurNAc-LAA domain-containing protein n=1 Tax=Sinosporangium siamense TaxID=1367973 RepID=A0A919VAA7_9ACTN|nr:N-acetylmuramoyl-L-alanine amidase [Sinosporangium siamense]GII96256.1 hypothetical protein Ssi02_64870 [Sinosporangium siamense]
MIGRALATSVLVLTGLGITACGGAQAGSEQAAGGEVALRTAAQATVTEAPPASAGAARATARPPLQGKVVLIDPGHNGANYKHPEIINRQVDVLTGKKACDTTGTQTANGYTEAAFNFDVSQRLAKLLSARGAKVKVTRTNNTGVGPCITKRAEMGNAAKADAALSVHADGAAPSAKGFHVILPKKINGPVDPVVADSKRLGIDIRDAVKAGTGLPYSTYIGTNALNFRNDIGGLNLSTVPKVLFEAGNMKNPSEAAKFQTPAFRQRLAEALATGLQNYLK